MTDTENTGTDQEMPLIAHLTELRSRVLRAVLCVLLIFVGLSFFANQLYNLVATPLLAKLPAGTTMIATEVASPFIVPFKLCGYVALFVSVPYLLYQAWAFIAPGLYSSERKLAFPLLVSSVILFYAGVAFAFFVIFPMLFAFFTSVAPKGVTVMTDISHYLDFVLKMFFAFGLAFEVPIATFLLVWSGVTTAADLSRHRPYVIVGAFTIGMLLTPPDVMSQVMLAVPIWMLFEAGLFLSKVLIRREPEDQS